MPEKGQNIVHIGGAVSVEICIHFDGIIIREQNVPQQRQNIVHIHSFVQIHVTGYIFSVAAVGTDEVFVIVAGGFHGTSFGVIAILALALLFAIFRAGGGRNYRPVAETVTLGFHLICLVAVTAAGAGVSCIALCSTGGFGNLGGEIITAAALFAVFPNAEVKGIGEELKGMAVVIICAVAEIIYFKIHSGYSGTLCFPQLMNRS